MKRENENLDEMFDLFKGQWDTEEPVAGHHDRFLDRLEKKKKNPKGLIYWITIPAAAAVVLLLSMLFIYSPANNTQLAKVSPKTKETQVYFASIINNELAKVKQENSPETKILVQDALMRMQELEKDYDRITHELASKGESKQLIHAMITNLQTRISFLEEVLTKIENIKKIKETYHENNQA
jgi:uncharacterized protein YsxB (DUF464 family)